MCSTLVTQCHSSSLDLPATKRETIYALSGLRREPRLHSNAPLAMPPAQRCTECCQLRVSASAARRYMCLGRSVCLPLSLSLFAFFRVVLCWSICLVDVLSGRVSCSHFSVTKSKMTRSFCTCFGTKRGVSNIIFKDARGLHM